MSLLEDEDKIDVRGDGRVILYKRPGLKNPKWQARIRVPNASGYKIVSTKTANLREAERFAFDLYEDLYLHVKAGGSIRTRTFRQVFEEWETNVNTMGPNRQGGSWSATIDRVRTYALQFFDSMKITEIGQPEFTEFWAWRKSNFNRKPPSNGTLKRERTCILPVFKYALSKGYLSKVPSASPPQSRSSTATGNHPGRMEADRGKCPRLGRRWKNEGIVSRSLCSDAQLYHSGFYRNESG